MHHLPIIFQVSSIIPISQTSNPRLLNLYTQLHWLPITSFNFIYIIIYHNHYIWLSLSIYLHPFPYTRSINTTNIVTRYLLLTNRGTIHKILSHLITLYTGQHKHGHTNTLASWYDCNYVPDHNCNCILSHARSFPHLCITLFHQLQSHILIKFPFISTTSHILYSTHLATSVRELAHHLGDHLSYQQAISRRRSEKRKNKG